MKHRRRRAAAAVTGVVAATVGTLWFVWLPSYRPALGPGERYGIDVSHHQGQIDWTSVATDDISFAYIKATQGDDFTDERFAENWRGAAAAGLERGAYHFFSLCTPGAAQAQHFLSVLPPDPGELPEAIDLELSGNCDARPDAAVVARELEAFLAAVESATGRPMVLYLREDFDALYPVAVERPRWVARFLRRPPGDVGWALWQVGGIAHVDGIEGKVDLDVAAGSAGDVTAGDISALK